MENRTDRTQLLIGLANLQKLAQKRVAVFGVGGVGGMAVEALARTGVGYLRLIDADVVAPSNINRQLVATTASIGQSKVALAKERIAVLNPDCQVETHQVFFLPEQGTALLENVDYILDCIDTVTAKLYLIEQAKQKNIPIISAMGAGNRFDPSQIILTDLAKTQNCRLARVMRRELRQRNIRHLKVVASTEIPQKPFAHELPITSPGSMMFAPATAGLLMASAVVSDLLK